MKLATMLVAATLPAAALAEQNLQTTNFDYEQLRGSHRVSEIIGSSVESRDGQEMGEVQDVILTSNGEISSILIEADSQVTGAAAGDADVATTDASERREGRDSDEARVQTEDERVGELAGAEQGDARDRHDATQPDDTNYMARDDLQRLPRGTVRQVEDGQFLAVDWGNSSFDPEEGIVRLEMDSQSAGSVGEQRVSGEEDMQSGGMDDAATRAGEFRASDLLGMDVNLSDEESFGEVEDILVGSNGEATALVIDSWNFLTRDRYAIPVDLNSVNEEEGRIDYQLSAEEVEGFGEFNFEDYLETT